MKILIFKTFPMTLIDWSKIGMLDRELALFKYISKNNNINYSLATFGDKKDFSLYEKCKPIKIIPFFYKCSKIKSYLLKFFFSFLIPFFFIKKIKKNDILQSNQFWGIWILIICKFFFKKKIILRQGYDFYEFFCTKKRNFFIKNILKYFTKFTYYYSDAIVVTTKKVSLNIEKKFKIKKNKIRVIPNYVDTKLFYPNNIIEKNNKILCIGRLTDQKNYNLLFESLKYSNYEVDIIGHGERGQYTSIINKFNLKVNFLGNISNSELPKVYNSYKLFILCSLYEGHPKTLLEAMACGITCIGTNVTGIKELHNGNNFHLVDLNSLNLKNKIDSIMNKKSEINIDSVKFVDDNFSKIKISSKFINLYKSI